MYGSSRIFLLGILIFKGLTVRRLYKSFGIKGLTITNINNIYIYIYIYITVWHNYDLLKFKQLK
jgi:hypothetical protein